MLVEQRKINKKDAIVVCSFDIAKTFGKNHDDVIKNIEALECSKDFYENNFCLVEREEHGKSSRMYYITRDGFSILAMADCNDVRLKEAYLRQFNEMEKLFTARLIEREKGIVIRQALTKAIKESKELTDTMA